MGDPEEVGGSRRGARTTRTSLTGFRRTVRPFENPLLNFKWFLYSI
jgi:hypothetical protein